jgi:hypothetical protein
VEELSVADATFQCALSQCGKKHATVLEGNHIDRADEIALPVIRQKRLYGEGAEVDVQYPDTGEKLWKLDERAHFPERPARQGQAL